MKVEYHIGRRRSVWSRWVGTRSRARWIKGGRKGRKYICERRKVVDLNIKVRREGIADGIGEQCECRLRNDPVAPCVLHQAGYGGSRVALRHREGHKPGANETSDERMIEQGVTVDDNGDDTAFGTHTTRAESMSDAVCSMREIKKRDGPESVGRQVRVREHAERKLRIVLRVEVYEAGKHRQAAI